MRETGLLAASVALLGSGVVTPRSVLAGDAARRPCSIACAAGQGGPKQSPSGASVMSLLALVGDQARLDYANTSQDLARVRESGRGEVRSDFLCRALGKRSGGEVFRLVQRE